MLRAWLRALAILTLGLATTPVWAHGSRLAALSAEAPVPALALTEPARATGAPEMPTVATLLEPALAGSRAARPTHGPAEVVALLIAALGLAGPGRAWRRDRRRALAMTASGLLLGFVVETTPHLVHHSLDPDRGASCRVLQAAERNQAVIDTPDALLVSAPAYLEARPMLVPAPALSAPTPCGRAPPA